MPNVDQTGQALLNVWPEGMLTLPDDLARSAISGTTGLAAYTENLVGIILAALGMANSLPSANPVTLTATGGLGLQASGSASTPSGTQRMIAQGRPLDSCPATPFTLGAADPTNPRIDLICVKANRVQGSSMLTRTVRADGATPNPILLSGTLVAGACTISLAAEGYAVAPVALAPTPIGDTSNGVLRVSSINATQLVVKSSDSADTRTFNVMVSGAPAGGSGASTVIPQWENRPAWTVQPGTPSPSPAVPATPAGYEAFATVLVPAGATSLLSSNITTLFPAIPNFAGALVGASGSMTLFGGITLKWGQINALAADGTANDTQVTFPTAFPTALWHVFPSVDVGALAGVSPNVVTALVAGETAAGFKATAIGGGTGQTVTFRWLAIGV